MLPGYIGGGIRDIYNRRNIMSNDTDTIEQLKYAALKAQDFSYAARKEADAAELNARNAESFMAAAITAWMDAMNNDKNKIQTGDVS